MSRAGDLAAEFARELVDELGEESAGRMVESLAETVCDHVARRINRGAFQIPADAFREISSYRGVHEFNAGDGEPRIYWNDGSVT